MVLAPGAFTFEGRPLVLGVHDWPVFRAAGVE